MLNFSPEKLFIVGLIALVVLGPNRLPQAARTAGRFVAELRRMSAGFQDEVKGALAEPTEVFRSAVGEFRPPDFRPPDLRRSVRDAISTTLSPPAPIPPAAAPPDSTGMPAAPDDPSLN
jgi:sec-independent protein translocase protein TatB